MPLLVGGSALERLQELRLRFVVTAVVAGDLRVMQEAPEDHAAERPLPDLGMLRRELAGAFEELAGPGEVAFLLRRVAPRWRLAVIAARIVDGPDEVHKRSVARVELRK